MLLEAVLIAATTLVLVPRRAVAQDPSGAPPPPLPPDSEPGPQPAGPQVGPWVDIYGHVMTEMGYDFGRVDPQWFDVMRPTKLPSSPSEFGQNGQTFAGVRQTRFGVKAGTPTPLGELKGIFEWELFGVAEDAGQTTFRLRHAFFEIGQFGAGQYWSPFMDIDVFPNSLEYWGPNGMVFYRNVQARWMPIRGDTRLTFAAERPGATADAGEFQSRIELGDIIGRYPIPDISGEFRLGRGWGYVELAGIVRWIKWADQGTDALNLTGSAVGWGVNGSSNVRLWKKDVLKLQVVYGRGVENYMNDGGVDIGAKNNPGNVVTPVIGVPLPVLGVVAFVDLYWRERWSTSAGYSLVRIWNSDAQRPDAFRMGQYALANLLFNPTPDSMIGVEGQWGRRNNFADGFSVNDFKLQFSFRYNFAYTLGGKP